MDNGQLKWIANFIWNIADDVLRGVYVRGKYRDVILPMVVIRRLDAVLEDTKDAVLERKATLEKAGIVNQAAALKQAAGQAFYNDSPFRLRDLKSRAKQQQLKLDFESYLDGFSDNVQEILSKFKFRNQIATLVEADILGGLIEKFLDKTINLSPAPVLDEDGEEKLPALDNHAMGTIFEELIRRFNEENNEEAGEHFTPRDVVKLMANLILLPIADQIQSSTYTVYDGACGTGGMLTVAEETLHKLAGDKDVSIHLFGQESQPETYAISKADLLLKGEGEEAENFANGSTLSQDAFPTRDFDFMLSNPPYGKSWKTDLERMGGKKDIDDTRFVVEHDGDAEFSLITRSNDGQLMFLVNKLSKMKRDTPLGSRIAEVHNGSSLFTGDAGQGESNIRRWVIENDWLESIIALPLNMFYNTGIATYIWVLSNRKPEQRRGKVQLIDATAISTPLRKNLGKKNCEFNDLQIDEITKAFLSFKETEQSKIFPNEEFGYWKIVVERPLRLRTLITEKRLAAFKETAAKAWLEPVDLLVEIVGMDQPNDNFNEIKDRFEKTLKKAGHNLRAAALKNIYGAFTDKHPDAEPVIKKKTKNAIVYEPDTDLRDTEQVPLREEGGIKAFFNREVLPHVPDAWIDESKTLIGYEISFTKHFYKPQPLRTLDEIRGDLMTLQGEAEGLLDRIVAMGASS